MPVHMRSTRVYCSRCVPMNAALLDVWGATDYDFHCRKCVYTDDAYDAGAALRR